MAGDLAGDYALTPDPWQQIVLDDWLAEKGGRWASLTCGLSVPRQNGKNALIEIRELFGMVGRGEKFLHTAHEVKTARKAFKRLQHFFGTKANDPGAKFPELNALVVDVRNVNGQEAIYLRNGGSVEIVARSKNSARGFTVDVLIMDEAQEMSEDDLEALMPTTSSAPLGNPQWIFTGTPPGPNANGEIFTRVRDEAVSGKGVRLSWHEWSAAPGASLDDRDVWRAVNPALINGRLQFEVIVGERARFSPEGFGRERLGVWAEGGSKKKGDLPSDRWLDLKDPDAPAGTEVCFGVDVTGDRVAWIAAAWRREDDDVQVMLVPPIGTPESVHEWLPIPAHRLADECRRLVEKWSAPVLGPRAFEEELEEAGVDVLSPMSWPEFAAGCGAFADAIEAGTIHHGNQPALNEAVRVVKWRSASTGGERAFQLKDSPEVGPVAAAVRALRGLTKREPSGGWMVGL